MNARPIDPLGSTSMTSSQRALVEASERYRSMFIYHPHAAFSADLTGHYTDANAPALEMTGLSMEQLRRAHFKRVIHPDDIHILEEAFQTVLDKTPRQIEARVVRADSQIVEIRCSLIPVVVDNQVVGVHGIAEDITEANELSRRLKKADAAKVASLASVSHEFRTPLAAVIGASELLLDADLRPDGEQLARIVHRASQRLLDLVNDVLDFSRIDAHDVSLSPTQFQVRELVENLAQWATPLAESHGLSIALVIDESIPTEATGDSARISQVLMNLVHNAIKFTERGSVGLRVNSCVRPPDLHWDAQVSVHWVEFEVIDTGAGIANDQIASLFEPFFHADLATNTTHAGLGLGLATCRDLVDLMGGQIRVASAVGEGSTFTFVVPIGPPE